MNGLNYLKTCKKATRHCSLSMIAQQKVKQIKNEMLYQNLLLAGDIRTILCGS